MAQVQHENACVVVRLAGGITFSDAHRPLPIPASLQIGRTVLPYHPQSGQPVHQLSRYPDWLTLWKRWRLP